LKTFKNLISPTFIVLGFYSLGDLFNKMMLANYKVHPYASIFAHQYLVTF